MFLYRIAIAASVVTIAGCSGLGLGGSSEYACPVQAGVVCEPVSSVYKSVVSGSTPSKRAPQSSNPAPSSTYNAVESPVPGTPRNVATPVAASMPISASAVARPPSSAVAPIRSQPRILRGWIAPYEDADGDLVGDVLVYIPVDSGRWLVEHARQRIRDSYAPARPTAAGASAASSSPTSPPASAAPSSPTLGARSAPPPSSDAPDLATFASAMKDATAPSSAQTGAIK